MTLPVKPVNNLQGPVLAVGAVVFKDKKVLLVKRGNPPAKGMWAIPGGRVNFGETIHQAAEREILEETGIHIKAQEPIYSFEIIDRDKSGNILFHYYIVDFIGKYKSGQIQAGDDAAEAGWISEKDLENLQLNPKTLELLNEKFGFGQTLA